MIAIYEHNSTLKHAEVKAYQWLVTIINKLNEVLLPAN